MQSGSFSIYAISVGVLAEHEYAPILFTSILRFSVFEIIYCISDCRSFSGLIVSYTIAAIPDAATTLHHEVYGLHVLS